MSRVLAALLVLWAAQAPGQYLQPVEARLVANTADVRPGGTFDLGVVFRMQRGWHIYWANPGDAGLATSVRWSLPPGFTAGPLRWPVPERFEQTGGDVGYGYAGAVLLSATVRAPDQLDRAAGIPVGAKVGWLACEKICLRGTTALALTLRPGMPESEVDPALFAEWQERLPAEAGTPGAPAAVAARGRVPRGGAPGTIAVTVTWTAPPAAVDWFPPDDQALHVESIRARTRGTRTVLTFRARRLPGATGPAQLESVVVWRDAGGRRHGLRVPIDLDGEET